MGLWVDSANERPWFSFELWGLRGRGLPIFTRQREGYLLLSEKPWKEVGNSW